MAKYKIYGDVYDVTATSGVAIDCFAINGNLTDEQPKGKRVGYVTMHDGSVVECYKTLNPMTIVLPVLTCCLLAGGVFAYLMFGQPKDVWTSGAPIKTGVDKNVVEYNGFSAIRDNMLEIDFQNGNYPATIQVTGDGVFTEVITVEPNTYIERIPVTFTTEEGLADANITITTDTSSTSNAIVIEIPENCTEDSTTGLEGNWRGEYIYGVQ